MGYNRRKEIKGNVYGKLKATGNFYRKNGRIFEEVECLKCGYKHYVDRPNLLRGGAGCRKCAHTKHGMVDTRFYNIYRQMKARCNDKNKRCYKNYGGRGICVEWKTFDEFKRDMYESYLEHIKAYGEKETTIDRIDVNGNYCKENCTWKTMKEQQNNKRNSVGISSTARELGLSIGTVDYRYRKKGLSIEEIKEKYMTV